MTFANGDPIWITANNRKMEGVIVMASPNQKSLMIQMDGAIWINDGANMLAGNVALLMEDDGLYHVLHDTTITATVEARVES